MMLSIKNSPYIDRSLFEARYGVDPAVMFEAKINRLMRYGLIEVAGPSERKKLDMHHFAPLYSILGSTATQGE